MKSIVIYSSQTGNTKKLAQTVYETLIGEKDIYPVAEAPEPTNYDFIAVGFWLQAGKPDPKTSEYLQKIKNGEKLFLFATHGASPDSGHAKAAIQQAKELASSSEIVGTFNCQGEVNPKVIEKVSAKPEPPDWLRDAPSAVGHPDENDLENLKNIINSLMH